MDGPRRSTMKNSIRLVIIFIFGVCVLAALNCSRSSGSGPSPVLGEELLISTNLESILKCEPAVAMTDNVIVAAWNDSYGGKNSGITPGVVVGWAISLDQGKSFEFKGYLPEFDQKETFMAADSWFQTDAQGNIYLNILNWGPDKSEMYLYVMDGKDPQSWEKISHPASVSIDVGKIDRPMMFLHEKGRMWISYTQASRQDRIKRMRLIGSDDGGKTWETPQTLSEETMRVRGGGIPIAGTQDYVLAVWVEGEELTRIDELWYVFSKDRGKTFSRSKMFFRLENGKGIAPEGYNIGQGLGPISMDLTPVMSVVSGDNGRELFFITCVEGTENGSRLLHFYFDPVSEEFSRAESLSTSPDSVYKMLPASPSRSGYPAVLYYDRRNDLQNETLTDLYLNIKTPDEVLELKLNSASSNWALTQGDKDYAPFQRNYGDYISLTAHGSHLYAVWTDGREGLPRIHGRLITLK
jgi:hypothetical protein